MHFTKKPLTTSQNFASAELNYTTSIGRKFKLERIHFHASVNITETITITLDSKQGANYDVILRSKSLSGEQDYVYIPDQECNLEAGDEIKIQCTNANGLGTIYVEIKTSELP